MIPCSNTQFFFCWQIFMVKRAKALHSITFPWPIFLHFYSGCANKCSQGLVQVQVAQFKTPKCEQIRVCKHSQLVWRRLSRLQEGKRGGKGRQVWWKLADVQGDWQVQGGWQVWEGLAGPGRRSQSGGVGKGVKTAQPQSYAVNMYKHSLSQVNPLLI